MNHITIVSDHVEMLLKNWAELFGFNAPAIQDFSANDSIYTQSRRGKLLLKGKQAVIPMDTIYLELKTPDVFSYTNDYYDVQGNGPAFIGFTQNEGAEEIIKTLCEKGAEEADRVQYPMDYGHFAIMDTVSLLDTGICINTYRKPQAPIAEHCLPDFEEIHIASADPLKTAESWKNVFGIEREIREDSVLINAAGRPSVRFVKDESHRGIRRAVFRMSRERAERIAADEMLSTLVTESQEGIVLQTQKRERKGGSAE